MIEKAGTTEGKNGLMATAMILIASGTALAQDAASRDAGILMIVLGLILIGFRTWGEKSAKVPSST